MTSRRVCVTAVGVFALFSFTSSHCFALENVPRRTLIGPVVFHWFSVGKDRKWGQYQSPWLPIEGREKWDGSIEFWEQQTKYMIDARFNMILFQHARGFEAEELNHLLALRNLRDRGYEIPKVVPLFSAESFDCYGCPKDFSTKPGRDKFYETVQNFFGFYFSVFGRDELANYKEKALLGLWWVPGAETAKPDFFKDIDGCLEKEFDIKVYWSAHAAWNKADPDEINYLFNGMKPVQYGSKGNADLLVGFWPANTEKYSTETFLPRNGGKTYETEWDELISLPCDKRPEIIMIESYNEYTEGSGIYPALPVAHYPGDAHWSGVVTVENCFNEPCHPVEKTDFWAPNSSDPNAPFLYLMISAKKITEFFLQEDRMVGGGCKGGE